MEKFYATQYKMPELTFKGAAPAGSQAVVDVKARFTNDTEQICVDGFYAGNGTYKVRFYPRKAGIYQWQVSGNIQAQGELICELAEKNCDKDGHGIVRAKGYHFYHEDGKLFQPFGTTVYALVHQPQALIDTTMHTLSQSVFNKVRMCVFPKYTKFNENDPELYAFEKTDGRFDVNRPCVAFWDALERRIMQLDALGIQSDLILFHPYDCWGFSKFSKEECLVYLDFAMRRLAAFPNIWWSLANEYDLMQDFEPEWWNEFAAFIHAHDPYHHLLSNHNCLPYWDFTNEYTTHCCIQDENVYDTPVLQKKYGKPVVFDECCYEGNIDQPWGNISGFEMVNRFWGAMVCGGYCTHGETFYDEHDILWWGKGGVLHGKSPARIKFLRELIESLPGPLEYWEDGQRGPGLEEIRRMRSEGITEAMDSPFMRNVISLTDDRILRSIIDRNAVIIGHCGEEVYLRYYRRQCVGIGVLELPENHRYDIEAIDVWEMTRKKVLAGVCGHVEVPLPGKEGMAVLAVRERRN